MTFIRTLLGQGKVDVYGTVSEVKDSKGKSRVIPMVAIQIRERWFSYRRVLVDSISFLLICEKVVAADPTKDFVYNEDHEDAKIEVEFPAWAMENLQEAMLKTGPIVYDALKNISNDIEASIQKVKNLGLPEETVHKLLGQLDEKVQNPIQKYKRLHAKINGYALPIMDENKTIN